MRIRLVVASIAVALVLVTSAGCCGAGEGNGVGDFTEEESWAIAEEYLLNSPTFTYDGVAESLERVEARPIDCPSCWEFVFEFDCLHSGYGDRTGRFLLQVITPHTAEIKVTNGVVMRAVLDGKWDMMGQFIFFEGG
jgi:hypothetical protein